MKIAYTLFSGLFLLVGCINNDTEKLANCEMDKDGVAIKSELTGIGNRLISQKQETVIDLKKVGINGSDAKKLSEEYSKKYTDLKGVSYTHSINDNKMIENISINVEESELDKLINENIIQSDNPNVNEVNFDQSITGLEQMGMKCEVK